MISIFTLSVITLVYFAFLFAVAYYADKMRDSSQSIISNAYIYSLSMAVYLTSWTFYGSVGRAATTGLDFLPIYLGPTLIAFSWWYLLRKIVRICKEQNIVSIADFISSRYGKSAWLGAAVTIFAIVGIMPYIALQLKAISNTFEILVTPQDVLEQGLRQGFQTLPAYMDTALVLALLLALFSVLFGARKLDATERHEGLVAAIAVESIVKLVTFLIVGVFVTYGLFGGFGDIFNRFMSEFPQRLDLLKLDTPQTPYSAWFTLTFISMMAVMFLPRQFHAMVIENSHERHIKTAMWCFPAYMFLINLFVIPIALGGLLLNQGNATNADFFVLTIPLQHGHSWLAVLVFIGGFSAAAGMVMVSSVALSTMLLNHLIMPLILHFSPGKASISRLLLNLKRLGIVVVILLGYSYYRIVGETYALVNIGLISFMAVTQFTPAVIGGLFWKRGNNKGAMSGLIGGFVVWFYTLLLPSFLRSGWWEDSLIIQEGLFGQSYLRPYALFGLTGFDIWTHALFWTMFFNIGLYIAISLLTRPSEEDDRQAKSFVDVFKADTEPTSYRERLSQAPSISEFQELMAKFIGERQATNALTQYLANKDLTIDSKDLPEHEVFGLKQFTERTLAGSVGAAPARIILENYLNTKGSRMERVFDLFGSVTLSRTSSREQLSVLYEAAREVASGDDTQSILDNVLRLLQNQFRFDLCVIRMLDEDKMALIVQSQVGMSSEHLGKSERNLGLDTYIGSAFISNAPVVVNDTDTLDKPGTAQLIRDEGIVSFAHVPINVEGEPTGVLSVFSRSSRGIFTEEFMELFQNIAGQIGIAWRNARQTRKLIEVSEQQRELQIARSIQIGLLPSDVPDISDISLAGTCIPAHQVGGDYYDYLSYNNKELDLVIGDVSGHNIGAALIMAQTRTFIQSRAHDRRSAHEMLDELNRFLYSDLVKAELFITMFYAQYCSLSKNLTYSSAGHNPPLLLRSNKQYIEKLDADGLILGIEKEVEFEERSTQLRPGDVLLLYTDGITEAESRHREFFGEERLHQLLLEYQDLSPQQIIDYILDQVRLFTGTFHFRDDISLIVMKVNNNQNSTS
ncbi:SpoIIE family protein phosphatase [Desulfurispira natronophila]|uniref:Na+/proline symporter/serine phosphatase RsbU (Regulator of sigma subunit) n=1 Tax=Desulfurispira natronophila TaxID=682562 RepID=A0A7W7Y2R8_9BACT|nr:SpoIIE family protein phosphatase [Desulfurispira natronophila]MBB5021006.1 Na+/proline symporter/serine phosphatase RsbU (regulator of sigma subunit) [Desulfurispira natronophila]